MTRELCEKKKKLSDVDGSKLRPSETSGQKTFWRIRYATSLDQKRKSPQRNEEWNDLSKCALPHAFRLLFLTIPRFLVLIVSIIADKGVAKSKKDPIRKI